MKRRSKSFWILIISSFSLGVLLTAVFALALTSTTYTVVKKDKIIDSYTAESCKDESFSYGVLDGETERFYELQKLTQGIADFCGDKGPYEVPYTLIIKK